MESVATDKPDAFDHEYPGSSTTADGRFSSSVIHSYLSKRNYPAHVLSEQGRNTSLVLMIDDGKLYHVGGASD